MARHDPGRLHGADECHPGGRHHFRGAYAVQAAYGIRFSSAVYLWIPVLGNILAVVVIPLVGRLSDGIGRRPPIVVGALGSGLCPLAISTRSASPTCLWRS